MNEAKKRLLSGVKPTGAPHIGNYFGAMKQFVDFQEKYASMIFIADYHAFTSERLQKNSALLNSNILELAKDYLTIGIDPSKTILYQQSDVPEVTELAWMFNCLVTVPYLQRAHAYKDAEAKGMNLNVGTFDYPILMAADILIMDTDIVPVGKDQQQHLEIARDVADKFRLLYGDMFTSPESFILEDVAVILGTDGQKMSKSYGNTIPLFAHKDEIAKTVMGIVTDSSGDRPENVFAIHKLFRDPASLEDLYASNAGNYKILKEALIEDISSLVAPLWEKRKQITDTDVKEVLKQGGERAREIARLKMKEVRKVIGITTH